MDLEVDQVILHHMGLLHPIVQRYEMGIVICYKQVFDYFQKKDMKRIKMLVNYCNRAPKCEPITALSKFMEFLKNMNYEDLYEPHVIHQSIMTLLDKFNQFVNLRLINGETNYDISYEMV